MTELHILTQQRPENLISEEQQLSPIVMMMKIKPPRVCLVLPTALCVWWTGGHNLFQYKLTKLTSNKPVLDAVPESVWPNSDEITSSAISSCSCYLALGFRTSLLTLWDRLTTTPRPVVSLLMTSTLSDIRFINSTPSISHHPPLHSVHLLVSSRAGKWHHVTVEHGTHSHTMELLQRDADSITTAAEPLSSLNNMAVLLQKSGRVLLMNVISHVEVCDFSLPDTYTLSSSWRPVFGTNPILPALYVQADRQSPDGEEVENSVFEFSFPQSFTMDSLTPGPENTQSSSLQQQSGVCGCTI
ncbi:WD repeat-containing protein 93-like isoform X2 [Denticeps clupeoides]|uniref:Uncharacterized protein n=1 Tax=Denticeps clupeoides TaxID=299321 RepID=A0AAY4D6P2_9TELE|nr:WD repeat-containing protein 93-like isoform X2 [Denticeps clupeoides]